MDNSMVCALANMRINDKRTDEWVIKQSSLECEEPVPPSIAIPLQKPGQEKSNIIKQDTYEQKLKRKSILKSISP